MESFDRLGLGPTVMEALSAEGIGAPTAVQQLAVPVIRRGTSCVLRAAPGSGVLVAYGAPLLDRVEAGSGRPRAIVLTSDRARVRALALSLARFGARTGHEVGALGLPWARPEESDILFCTMEDLERGIRAARVKMDLVESLVVDGARGILSARETSDQLAAFLPLLAAEEPQVVLISDRVTEPVLRWVEGHMRRAVILPTEATGTETLSSPVQRGALRVLTLEGDLESAMPRVLLQLLAAGNDHILVFARSNDRAADLSSLMALHGFTVGRPGDEAAEVWLGVDPLEVRASMAGSADRKVAILSIDVPADADELDRRHGGSPAHGTLLVPPHQLPHIRRTTREAGYTLEPIASLPPFTRPDSGFTSRVEAAIEEEDLAPYLALLQPLIRGHSAAEVAAALAALLRRAERGAGRLQAEASAGKEDSGSEARPPAWTRLFLSVGKRDGIAARDLLGAIAGEAQVEGRQVGRIEVRDAFSRVEVQDSVAQRVIQALNGTSIRGRSVRVDYDRGTTRRPGRPAGRRKGRTRHGPDEPHGGGEG